jgi:hypothetical protein
LLEVLLKVLPEGLPEVLPEGLPEVLPLAVAAPSHVNHWMFWKFCRKFWIF